MLDRKLIEQMYQTATDSQFDGAHLAAGIYKRMLEMSEGETMSVQFEQGEEFVVHCTNGGYDLS